MKIRKLICFSLFLLLVFPAWSQTSYTGFHEKSMEVNQTGMYILGGWAVLNMAGGAIGWANNSASAKYFNQMNLFWNTVNLSIAGFAIYNNFNTPTLSEPGQVLQNHIKTENLYLINAGLDILYLGTGFYLKHLSERKPKRHDLLLGYGNSIVLQGSFLFVFDSVMWITQHSGRMHFLQNMEMSFTAKPSLLCFGFSIPFN